MLSRQPHRKWPSVQRPLKFGPLIRSPGVPSAWWVDQAEGGCARYSFHGRWPVFWARPQH